MRRMIEVIGAGLAGCEAAWQIARRGLGVRLYDMKPAKMTPAHHSPQLAELCCSNSLRAADLSNAAGLLKEELRRMGSIVVRAADETALPAGGALAVDRHRFSEYITDKIRKNSNIEFVSAEVTKVPRRGFAVVATGPLTGGGLFEDIGSFLGGKEFVHFFDAAAPLVAFDSIDMDRAFFASRYGKGTADYINCPMTREQYERFCRELTAAETAEVHGFEKNMVFEGCMPVEVMASRGEDTLRFGPLKPVGITDRHTGERPYAVVQLRRDNAEGTVYNLVGFQTHLKFPEQKRVFSLIPGLENAEFLRYGVMHRNSFIRSPGLLDRFYAVKTHESVAFAGQLTGVEGYIESAASGFYAGVNMAEKALGRPPFHLPKETATGALAAYISDEGLSCFQPMNINFGIISPLLHKAKGKRFKNLAISERALGIIDAAKAGLCFETEEQNENHC